jgi:hypothetical protein
MQQPPLALAITGVLFYPHPLLLHTMRSLPTWGKQVETYNHPFITNNVFLVPPAQCLFQELQLGMVKRPHGVEFDPTNYVNEQTMDINNQPQGDDRGSLYTRYYSKISSY